MRKIENASTNTTDNSISACQFFSAPAVSVTENELLKAALNAELDTVKTILDKANHEQCAFMLSTTGKAVITHLGIERFGTPLQMAIYGHDEQMIAFFKKRMNQSEFEKQCMTIVGSSYKKFLENQQAEAKKLCDEIKRAFESAKHNEFNMGNDHVVTTTSAELESTLSRFKKHLEMYTTKTAVYNPYILHELYEIYSNLRSKEHRHDFRSPEVDALKKIAKFFSVEVIGPAQSKMSARWLQHYVARIYRFSDANREKELAFQARSFIRILVDGSREDIRDDIASRIGKGHFLTIFGGVSSVEALFMSGSEPEKLLSSKNHILLDLIPENQPSSHCCCQL